MAVKDKRPRKLKLKARPKKLKKESILGRVVRLGGTAGPRGTAMNRDIPLGGSGGSPNLIADLTRQGLIRTPGMVPPQVIQTPDQFNIQQDIKGIRAEQATIAEEIAKERKRRADAGLLREENAARKEEEILKREMRKAAAIMKQEEAAAQRAKMNIKKTGAEKFTGQKDPTPAQAAAAAAAAEQSKPKEVPQEAGNAPFAPAAGGAPKTPKPRMKKQASSPFTPPTAAAAADINQPEDVKMNVDK
jgi:hypothetical protein